MSDPTAPEGSEDDDLAQMLALLRAEAPLGRRGWPHLLHRVCLPPWHPNRGPVIDMPGDPSHQAMQTVCRQMERFIQRLDCGATGAPVPPSLVEEEDPDPPFGLCQAALDQVAAAKRTGDSDTTGRHWPRDLGRGALSTSESLMENAALLWRSARMCLAAGRPDWAVVAAFQAGIAVMVCQRELDRVRTNRLKYRSRWDDPSKKSRSKFNAEERMEIGRRLDEAIQAYMGEPDFLFEKDARGRAYHQVGEALKAEHSLPERPPVHRLRRYLNKYREATGKT